MLPDNFGFAQMPELPNTGSYSLKEVGMLASTIENIDRSLVEYINDTLDLSTSTNEGFVKTPVLWQASERAYQVKNNKDLRDGAGALKLPLVGIERTAITKDPERKGGYQAQTYSTDGNGRTGRMVIARKIVQDKTRNFAVAKSMRMLPESGEYQKYYPRINKKVVIKSLSIPIPVYINLSYKIVIQAEYQQHVNELTAPFVTRTGQINSFLLRKNGHLYEAFIDPEFAQNNNSANLDEEMRMFKTEINIKVLGYLIGEGKNDDRPIVRVQENVVEVTFPRESAVVPGGPDFFLD
jgi:hypothetical protein